MIKARDLVQYGRQAEGGGYLWGSDGQTSSLRFRNELAARLNPATQQSTIDNILRVGAKWDGRACWDCSGLFRGAWRKLMVYKSGGSTTIWNTWCTETGPIGTMPDEPGIAVFRGTTTPRPSMSHVGLYIGNGEVVDARGTALGVLRRPLNSYAWTHWGRLRDVAYNDDAPTAVVPTPLYQAEVVNVNIGLNLRTSPVNTTNTILLIPKGGVVDVLQDNAGGGFAYVRYFGILGYCTRSYLLQLDADDDGGDEG